MRRIRLPRMRLIVVLAIAVSTGACSSTSGVVTPESDVESMALGRVFVWYIGKPAPGSSVELYSVFERNRSFNVYVSEIDERKGRWEAEEDRVVAIEPDGASSDRIVRVAVMVHGSESVREEISGEQWRDEVADWLREAAHRGTALVFSDGTESPAAFGPDGNLIYFQWNNGWFRTDENGEIVRRHYIWQEMDPYFALIPFHFPVSSQEIGRVEPVVIRIGDLELNLK